jgi:hypothetical protein
VKIASLLAEYSIYSPEFGLRCITTVMLIDLSKKPIIGLDLLEHTLQDPLTFIIRDLISACDGKIGAMSVRFQEQEHMQDSLLMVIEEIGNSKLSEVSFECCNERLHAQILTIRWFSLNHYLCLHLKSLMNGSSTVLCIYRPLVSLSQT